MYVGEDPGEQFNHGSLPVRGAAVWN
jgi:hypothetical protein